MKRAKELAEIAAQWEGDFAPKAPRETQRRHLQGLPLGSGMGSSAASAAAGAWAVNSLFGAPLGKDQLVYAGLASEAAVSGYHADNIAPALMGGFILIRCVLRHGRCVEAGARLIGVGLAVGLQSG